MSDKFENDLRDHLHKEAEEIREFPRRLRGRIREGIAPRARARMAPQLALVGALVLVAFAVLAVRSPQVILNEVRSTVTQIFTTPSPSPTPQPFIDSDRSGGTTGLGWSSTSSRRPQQRPRRPLPRCRPSRRPRISARSVARTEAAAPIPGRPCC